MLLQRPNCDILIAVRKLLVLPLCLVTALAAAQTCTPPATLPITNYCGLSMNPVLTCRPPSDISINPESAIATQRSANVFSWEEFFALNWPAKAGERGVPDISRPFTSMDGPRVWETWKESYEVFLKDGSAPPPWNSPQGSPFKLLMRTQKIQDFGIDSALQAASAKADPPPKLTDQKHRLVRYEIRFNKVMFDYIVKNKLYNGITQASFGTVTLPNGSMLIKAAWREVDPAEEKGFYVVNARVCRDADGRPVNCRSRRMALVGFHITQLTPSAPQWVWTTFEQVNNVPGTLGHAPYSFNNPGCRRCAPNQQTVAGVPAQLTRLLPIPAAIPDCSLPFEPADNLMVVNREIDTQLLKMGSVFGQYQLVNTQYPASSPSGGPVTAFTATPVILANTTMESYVQETSTCIGCHSTARTSNINTFYSAHFEFQLNNAQPKPPLAVILTLPKLPQNQWEKENWAKIELGGRLVNNTYELLPAFVPAAKLHCTSCHLHGGADSKAAWWVDMEYAFPTPQKLAARINECFERSLNGKPLCSTSGGNDPCETNNNMQAIITYMHFLTEVYGTPGPNTPHGFPPIPAGTGNVSNGQAAFAQKCAACHQSNGAGRYEDNKYFRPALWGPHSFNFYAGMFSQPADLAAFLRWNMPFGAGGLLSDQEAWDLEAYVHAQPRPGLKSGSSGSSSGP